MKYISNMELMYLLETLRVLEEELSAAIDDGWVVTTDIHDLLHSSRRLINAALSSPNIEVTDD